MYWRLPKRLSFFIGPTAERFYVPSCVLGSWATAALGQTRSQLSWSTHSLGVGVEINILGCGKCSEENCSCDRAAGRDWNNTAGSQAQHLKKANLERRA